MYLMLGLRGNIIFSLDGALKEYPSWVIQIAVMLYCDERFLFEFMIIQLWHPIVKLIPPEIIFSINEEENIVSPWMIYLVQLLIFCVCHHPAVWLSTLRILYLTNINILVHHISIMQMMANPNFRNLILSLYYYNHFS